MYYIYMEIHGYICYLVNARIMKFIPNEIRIMFSRVSSINMVLDRKNLKFKIFSGKEIQGLHLTASIVGS